MSDFLYKRIEIPVPPDWTPEQLYEHMKAAWGNWYDDSMDDLFAYPGKKAKSDVELDKELRFVNPNETIPGWSLRGI